MKLIIQTEIPDYSVQEFFENRDLWFSNPSNPLELLVAPNHHGLLIAEFVDAKD